jgi:ribonuclease HI
MRRAVPGEAAALKFLQERNENLVALGWGDASVVYTDGACSKNGKEGAHAGFGVWYGDDDARNMSAALEGELQTNQRAELAAFLHAVEVFAADVPSQLEGRRLLIKSDSRYCVDGWKSWLDGWISRGWLTSTGNPVVNEDFWRRLSELRDLLSDAGAEVAAVWVKGHAESRGNQEADALAVAGRNAHALRAEYENELEAKRLERNARAREKARRKRAAVKEAAARDEKNSEQTNQ